MTVLDLRHATDPGTSDLSDLCTIDLATVTAQAALIDRMDRKYLVPLETFDEFVSAMSSRLRVLEIDKKRSFDYDSVYFDTPSLLTYHQHLQKRRRRYKVRTRTYLDSCDCLLEVKLNGARDSTAKRRMPWSIGRRETLTPQGLEFIGEVLHNELGLPLPRLEPTLRTTYKRTTLVSENARYTCDTELRFVSGNRVVRGPRDHVLVEVKSSHDKDPGDRVLRKLGVRPATISKYAIAVALLWPGIRANPWRLTIRRYF